MDYSLLKQLHLATIGITLALFVLRGFWMMTRSPRLQARWVRIVPHVNDTILLASGISLSILIQQYPLTHSWLTAKLFALMLYIVLGTVALKHGKSQGQRIAAWVAALLVFGYMVAVAITHTPFPSSTQTLASNSPQPELSILDPLYPLHL
ncbi:MAG TPA: SirB2 family protein [Thiobacillus sp.]